MENGDGNELIVKCRKLAGGFNHSTQLNEKLPEDQKTANEQEKKSKKAQLSSTGSRCGYTLEQSFSHDTSNFQIKRCNKTSSKFTGIFESHF